jgi:hypothetical protein
MTFRLQFRLRSLFILTAIVAVGCLVGPPIFRHAATVRFRFDERDQLGATALLLVGFWLMANRRASARRPSNE